ncbi:transferrin [Ischnura elegans]|uniref:transferrin n=1 Tax=Ischnura elegans TaxID=197161 RepID=UPI001ED8BFA0|nr:transferrin [Ischnura elegans]
MGKVSRLLALLLVPAVLVTSAPTKKTYKVCVPTQYLEACQRMTEEASRKDIRLQCYAVRDRVECYEKIRDGSADFGPAEPEDMYVANHLPNSHFVVFEEIRDKNATHDDVRYGGVALVRTDLPIPDINALRGLKSCHTGVGRTVGYKIPLTKLTAMGILPQPDRSVPRSQRENELWALSQTFPQACLVGDWSPDQETNRRLKSQYSSLCSLCEHPEACNYPDKYSGYDGAIRCMIAPNRGDVAWTKVVVVRQFFGLPPFSRTPEMEQDPLMNLDLYSYLCPDGTKQPLTTAQPCTWAGRPWPGYIAHTMAAEEMEDLREQITEAVQMGESEHLWQDKTHGKPGDWLSSVFALREITTAVENGPEPPTPEDYLKKARYLDVISRELGTLPPLKFCTWSEIGHAKCESLKLAAFPREIRPRLECVMKHSSDECMAAISKGEADVVTLDGGEIHTAQKKYQLKPFLAEIYSAEPHSAGYYSVAVVRANSTVQSFADLRGHKSCHTGYGRTAGWNVPLNYMLEHDLVSKTQCPYTESVTSFFSGGSCTPDIKKAHPEAPDSLCALCPEGCSDASATDYSGYSGAFRCLATGLGDVAFVRHTTVKENTDEAGELADWSKGLHSDDFKIVCPDGGLAPVSDYLRCNLAKVPPHMVVTSATKTDSEIANMRHILMSISSLFHKRPEVFQLFGSYKGVKDLIFKDNALGLKPLTAEDSEIMQSYQHILDAVTHCDRT